MENPKDPIPDTQIPLRYRFYNSWHGKVKDAILIPIKKNNEKFTSICDSNTSFLYKNLTAKFESVKSIIQRVERDSYDLFRDFQKEARERKTMEERLQKIFEDAKKLREQNEKHQ